MVIPHLFTKTRLPASLPQGMERIVLGLKRSKSKKECLRKAYDILTKKYRGYRGKTYYRAPELFVTDTSTLWKRSGFLHCTQMNYLMRILLVKSGWFADEEILPQFTFVMFFSPHQYLRIQLSEQENVAVDLWGKAYNVPFGDYARGFR